MRGRALCALLLWAGTLLPAPAAARARPVAFGIQTPQENTTYAELVRTWRLAEELGYESAWLYDHFIPIIGDKEKPCLESWTLLSALATQTKKIRIGILVTGNTYRNPALVAKMAVTVDRISGGRLNLGIGAAWNAYEHRAYGFPFYTARERAERLGEALEVITRLFAGGPPTFEGRYYHLFQAPFAPPPIQQPHPPIVVGGQGKRWIMPLVARYAEEWNVPIGIGPDGIRERLQIVRAECKRVGRSPCVQEVSVFLPLVNITGVPLAGPATRLGARLIAGKRVARSVLAGSPKEIQKRIREFLDAGATRVIVNVRPPFSADLIRRFATEVMPAFR